MTKNPRMIKPHYLKHLSSRCEVYLLLSRQFAYPDDMLVAGLRKGSLRQQLLRALNGLYEGHVLKEEALLNVLDSKGHWDLQELQAQYNRIFNPSQEMWAPPYETEYGLPHVFAKVQALADISGFYNAFGFTLNSTARERPDFIGTELEFMHILTLKELYALVHKLKAQGEITVAAQQAFLRDHLGKWLPAFARMLESNLHPNYYSALVKFTAKFVECECRELQVESGRPTTILPVPVPYEEFRCPPEKL